jgi:hypothetical protein
MTFASLCNAEYPQVEKDMRIQNFAAALLAGGLLTSAAQATPIVYQLDEITSGTINNGTTVAPTSGFGSVTYAAHNNNLMVTIALTTGFKALDIAMNVGTPLANLITGGKHLLVTNDGLNYSDIQVSMNHISQDGYQGSFDIQVPGNGNLGNANPVSFDLILASSVTTNTHGTVTGYSGQIALDPSEFNALDTLGFVYNDVHVGNCSTNAACAALGGSIFVGSDGITAHTVPEPASIALLGLGLIGLGTARRRTA